MSPLSYPGLWVKDQVSCWFKGHHVVCLHSARPWGQMLPIMLSCCCCCSSSNYYGLLLWWSSLKLSLCLFVVLYFSISVSLRPGSRHNIHGAQQGIHIMNRRHGCRCDSPLLFMYAGEHWACAGSMCDPGGLEVVSDQTQNEKSHQSCQQPAEEIQVSENRLKQLTLSKPTNS